MIPSSTDFLNDYMEAAVKACDGSVDSKGYSQILLEEMELEAAKRKAMEAASGFRNS